VYDSHASGRRIVLDARADVAANRTNPAGAARARSYEEEP
jgi:hypothetical protein